MCYAIPGKVIDINHRFVTVDYFGEKKKAINELTDLKVGDYIYAQGGYVINRLSQSEAQEILKLWKEVFFHLKEVDKSLSSKVSSKNDKLSRILDKASQGINLTKKELLYLINLDNEEDLDALFKTANFLRQKYLGNSCCIHGIIEFSNSCTSNCLYCGISTHNKKIKRFRITKEEILEEVKKAVENYGFKALVLQSGEDKFYTPEILAKIVKEIKARFPVLIFISCGEIGIKGLEILYKAGARGLLMRFETGNPKIYTSLHPFKKLEIRLKHLKEAYNIGYLIITGSLIGLPGQTKDDLINDILLAKELHAEMYSFGPFLPHPETPLKELNPPEENLVLKVIALTRIIDPKNAKILVTTGFETLSKEARRKGLLAGANSLMLNLTPEKYKYLYDIYPKRANLDKPLSLQIEETLNLLKNLGRAPTDLGIC